MVFLLILTLSGCVVTGAHYGVKSTHSQSVKNVDDTKTSDNPSDRIKDDPPSQKSPLIIKIGLLTNVSSFNLSGESYVILSRDEKRQVKEKSDDYFVSANSSGRIIIDNREYTPPVRIQCLRNKDGDKNFIRINGKPYRGDIVVTLLSQKSSRQMTVINEVDIEDYLKGVLPAEMNPNWPLEALKSQAVAARSFAWKNIGRHQKDGYDLCSTVHCQVYTGVLNENIQTNRAVDETGCEILVDPVTNETANAVFHACCGGYTEEPSNVWDIESGKSPSYLSPRRCTYCGDYPHFNWNSVVDADLIKDKLNQNGWKIGIIKKLELVGRNVSGRARFIRVIHSKGTTVVPAGKFRLAVDAWKIKSTKLSAIVRRGDKTFEFRGQGWGHGVGMCQAGAKGMAEAGKNYRQILGFYYNGAVLDKIKK